MTISYPADFIAEINRLLGDESSLFWDSQNSSSARSGLRINSLKTNLDLIKKILPPGSSDVPWAKDGLQLPLDVHPGKHPYHAAGLYYLQDPSAMAVAEVLDHERQGSDAQDVGKLLLVASLANIQNAVLGLTPTEVMADICAPDRDITALPAMVERLETQLCWYLHKGRDGRLHFKNNQHLVAKLRSTAEAYGREASLKELKSFLNGIFIPERKDCYQDVLVLPAVDEIQMVPDKVKMILYEPCAGGLHTDLRVFYEDLDYKNRVLFLSGARDTHGR